MQNPSLKSLTAKQCCHYFLNGVHLHCCKDCRTSKGGLISEFFYLLKSEKKDAKSLPLGSLSLGG